MRLYSLLAATCAMLAACVTPAPAASLVERQVCADPNARHAMAACTTVISDPDHAIADYDEAIRLNPGNSDVLFNRGNALPLESQHACAALAGKLRRPSQSAR